MSSESTLAGGVRIPEGYQLVNSISEDEDLTEQNSRFSFDDLRDVVVIEPLNGVSATLDNHVQGSATGVINIRLIHDFKARVYLFRRDKESLTEFRLAIGHNVD